MQKKRHEPKMAFLKNTWYVAAESHEITDGLLGRVICGDAGVLQARRVVDALIAAETA